MRLRSLAVMVALLLVASAVCSEEEEHKLRPGVGAGNFLLLKTKRAEIITQTRDENYYAQKGLWFSFNRKGLLDTIVTTSPRFSSDKGVRPGDAEAQVQKYYGRGAVGQYKLQKGLAGIGTVGDKTLIYPGIHFVIANRKVWAVVIVPKT